MRTKLGESLIKAGLLTEDDLRIALAEHAQTGERVGAVLVRLNLATETQMAKALAAQLGFPYLGLAENPPDPAAMALIPKAVALERECVAVRLDGTVLTVAMCEPMRFSLVQDLEQQTACLIRQVVSTHLEIVEAIRSGYPDEGVAQHLAAESRAGLEADSDAPMADLVDLVVKRAIESEATDVHVEPMEKVVRVRHRLDGVLAEAMALPKNVHDGLIARLKIMAGMDAAETRLPQEGRLRAIGSDGTEVDFRVSTLRTLFGEKLVMRLRDQQRGAPPLQDIGLSATALECVRGFLAHRRGLMLAVGPIGSGTTTTLSSALAALGTVQSKTANIITIEDPVEYQIPGANQMPINEQIGLTFARALVSILRQDPDIILLGELPDAETATIAIQAAQTAHLVLSTLHADAAPSAVRSLIDMGVEPAVVASTLVGVIAQRLVRRLCMHCRRQYTPPTETLRALNLSDGDAGSIVFYESVGCDRCHYTGYRGRIGVFEVMRVTDRLRRLIAACAPEDELREAAFGGGMISLAEDGLSKVKIGVTTPEELLRIVTDVREMRALCPGCGGAVGVDFLACPKCGKRLGSGCPHCGRAMQPGWQFCPYCARGTNERRG